MVRLSKSVLPPSITIKSEDDYRKGEVLQLLSEDCHNKCYICECKPTTINVEHIKSRKNNPKLEFDWNNLFIACGHCNSIKSTKYDDILDPTKCDPEEHIALSVDISDKIMDGVKIETLTTDSSTLMTAELLEFVYNGGSTDMKRIESTNLRNSHLMPNIHLFYRYISNHKEEPDLGYDKLICKEIRHSSIFAAFKRKIVRDDPKLAEVFSDLLDDISAT